MPVAHHAPPTIGKNQIGRRDKERLEFCLDCAIRRRAPERRISVSGSSISAFRRRETTLFSFMA
jgi:hypothetical protein